VRDANSENPNSKNLISKKMTSMKNIVRAALLWLLVLGLAGVIAPGGAHAQYGTSPPKQADPPLQQQSNPPRQHSVGMSQQLAHQTREAAGEEADENKAFKESPSVSLDAKWTGMTLQHAYWLCVLLNFVVIAAVMIWASGKYLPGIFRARTAGIQKAMQEAQKASEEARRKLAEIETRLQKLDVEIGSMRDLAEKEAGVEEARIQAAAHEDARKIVETAQQEIVAITKAARRDLTAYAADLAVNLAQKQIHVDAATDQVLVRNFAGELASEGSVAPGQDGR
jgi:F-type H+-transporting ATPase subunit b